MKSKFEKCLESGKPVVLAFFHYTNEDAAVIKEDVEKLRAEFGDKCEFLLVDGPDNHELAHKCHIDVYPAWVMFKGGQEVWNGGGIKKYQTVADTVRGFLED